MKYTQKKSLEEVHSTVATANKKGFWRTLLAFLGPAYLVSVGYMDPGNWATDIAGGSKFGYTLIWVLLMSNLMALLLQSLSARLGLVQGRDLAQASQEKYPFFINFFLYILAEIAIIATDLAEILGMAIGLQLLFGLPLLIGVSITVLDTFLILLLQNYGIRKLEAFILALIAVIGIAFLIEMLIAKPEILPLVKGFIPSLPNHEALYIAIGIIGATVMPHNLYLHSSLVQTREIERTEPGIRKAIRFNFFDTTIALNLAFFVNAAILILAASVFNSNNYLEVVDISDAHKLLAPLLGSTLAPFCFAIALIAAGQSSTLTGTLAGQIVMEGYLNLRIQPWLRRIITRIFAILPAFFTIYFYGEKSTGNLLILSQVILSLQLGFAVIPLIHFVSDKLKMGVFAISSPIKILSWTTAIIIVSLNVKLVIGEMHALNQNPEINSIIVWIIYFLVACTGILLLYIALEPFIKKLKLEKTIMPHGPVLKFPDLELKKYKKIALGVDFSASDSKVINFGISQGGKEAEYLLIHVVETAGAMFFGSEVRDYETDSDQNHLDLYVKNLKEKGYAASSALGYGNPRKVIPNLTKDYSADLLILGAHGHKGLKDLLFGETVNIVRHRVNIPVLIV
ncbi:MAG: iron/manganese transporter [Bacteroidetes bacterium RIFCSPLOWO2_02_FULL_36_8]|nr:MAG: iron/manganese transporter [Bacteroidetes bacterium RIFCSPLOWO2_02_FULL_36_8]OFY72127.1 MAG: iron/manganese transporter [Bacteroidetes bacterium RIFCSPLOWO2_12_FULL_37_12]